MIGGVIVSTMLLIGAGPEGAAPGAGESPAWTVEFLDSTTITPDWTRGEHADWPATELSGIEALPRGWYMVVSDDRGKDGPPRYGFLRIDFRADPATREPRLRGVGRIDLHPFLRSDGQMFEQNIIDPESIRLIGEENRSRQFLVASEGYAMSGLGPRLYLFDQLEGGASLDLTPPEFDPTADRGIRHNRGFEALGVTPDRAWAYTANEEPLAQDEPTGLVRIIEVDLAERSVAGVFAYELGPPTLRDDPLQLGLVELVALERGRMLALERDEDGEGGFDGRLYLVETQGADDVSGVDALSAETTPVRKTLIATFSELGVPTANYEGFCFGPAVEGGRLLILVSDGDTDPANAARFTLLRLTGEGAAPPPAPRD